MSNAFNRCSSAHAGFSSSNESVANFVISVIQLILVCCVTYPLYVMTDKTTPILKSDQAFGFISVTTLAFISAAYYAVLNIISKFHNVFGPWRIPVATGVVTLLFFGSCDVFNAIRTRKREEPRVYVENYYLFREHYPKPNARAQAVAAFTFIEFFLAVILLVIAIIDAKRDSFHNNTLSRVPSAEIAQDCEDERLRKV